MKCSLTLKNHQGETASVSVSKSVKHRTCKQGLKWNLVGDRTLRSGAVHHGDNNYLQIRNE